MSEVLPLTKEQAMAMSREEGFAAHALLAALANTGGSTILIGVDLLVEICDKAQIAVEFDEEDQLFHLSARFREGDPELCEFGATARGEDA